MKYHALLVYKIKQIKMNDFQIKGLFLAPNNERI